MIYVMSDIHGEYESFIKMTEKIHLKDDDLLFLLGDIVDYGEDSMKLLCDISMRANVFPIFGEHDLKAYKMLKEFYRLLSDKGNPNADYIRKMQAWTADGGATTLEGFSKLNNDMKEGIIDFFGEFTVYEEISANGEDFVLVHAGIADFDENKDLSQYPYRAFFSVPLDFSRRYYKNKTIIAGHTDTSELNGGEKGKICRGNGSIAVNCGVGFGGRLGCLCLDNGREYYV